MKTQADIAFYSMRAKQSHDAAVAAREVCARDAHQAFAVAYEKVLGRIIARQEPALATGLI